MSTDGAFDEAVALDTIAAAVEAGVTVFDTAHAYGRGPSELGQNERLLARGIRSCGGQARVRIVTKGGMTRTGGTWIPDGRAKALRMDCDASLEALDGLPIDTYLVHAPDPRTPWPTTLRALARLVDEGLVRRVGVSNVNRSQLDQALDLAPVKAVQVAINPYDDRALRGGIVERCAEAGIALVAHSPLGGPRRAGGLARDRVLATVADGRGATPAQIALAWLLELSPVVVAIPGARRPETARSAARAGTLSLDPGERAALAGRFGRPPATRLAPADSPGDAEVVLVMGIPGAGKSRVAQEYVGRGYLRLNRDARGGTLRQLADALDQQLSAGARRVVLDNTYLTRAARSYVVEAAARHQLPARCIWTDTPLAQAQVNVVERLLERFGHLPAPEELQAVARREPGILLPTSQMRAFRELEPPSADEGLMSVVRLPFRRLPWSRRELVGVFVAAAALEDPGWARALELGDRGAPHLVFDWIPDGNLDVLAARVASLSAEVSGKVESAVCPHPGGPPSCWCRPPLPGLALQFSRTHRIDPSRSILFGAGPAHRTLATTLGARYVALTGAMI